MADRDIAELEAKVADLERGLHAMTDATHATLHLLSFLYTIRCMSAPDPIADYKALASVLLASIGAVGEAELPRYDDAGRDALARGMRHHIGQFLLTVQGHVEANIDADLTPATRKVA